VSLIAVAVVLCIVTGCTPPVAERSAATTAVDPAPGTTAPAAATTGPIARAVTPSVTTPVAPSDDVAADEPSDADADTAEDPADDIELAAVEIVLPAPAFRGTPVPLKEPHVEKPLGHPRPPFLAPVGTKNLALGAPVETSDAQPTAGEVDFVTDGDKEASDFGLLELHGGPQWIQIDLGQPATVYGVLVWHNHADARVYRDVVVQVSDEPYFIDPVTIFNNDYDGTAGLGLGEDMGYVETSEGKLIDARGIEGRYVRLISNGSTVDGKNHYTEVEIYGVPLR
jgi:hypothetical protein